MLSHSHEAKEKDMYKDVCSGCGAENPEVDEDFYTYCCNEGTLTQKV